jgi:type IV conjugative transfer system coupling protein TraD
MISQIIRVALIASLILFAGVFAFKCYRGYTKIPKSYLSSFFEYSVANVRVSVAPDSKKNTITQSFSPIIGKPYERKSITILKDMEIKFDIFRLKNRLAENAIYAGIWSGGCFVIFIGGWTIIGNRHRKKKHERGAKLADPEAVKVLLYKEKRASDLQLGKLPLVKDKETSHILVTGTTGSGKSNCFNILLPQIRRRGDRAVIIDLTGEYVAKYYDSKKDKILNPLDQRTAHWSLWSECDSVTQFNTMASSFFPDLSNNSDPFWVSSARKVFAAAAYKLKGTKEPRKKLLYLLTQASLTEVTDFFKDTIVAALLNKDNEKTTASIRAVTATNLECLQCLSDSVDPFSIRKWLDNAENTEGWLFLSCSADQRATLKPLLSVWMDIAINGLLSLIPDSKRRVWFVIDELAALNKLSSLQTVLAESRKYGGCALIGTQSVPQIQDLYGSYGSSSIFDLFNTRIFFRTMDYNTASWISKVLGEVEYSELTENLSYGAHEMRDGVSLSKVSRTKPLVIASELITLSDLEAYIQLPDTPITRMKMKYQHLPTKAASFIKIEQDKFQITRSSEYIKEGSLGVDVVEENVKDLMRTTIEPQLYKQVTLDVE